MSRFPADKIVARHADHGTHERFHSGFKSEPDLEGLPSGKFDSSDRRSR